MVTGVGKIHNALNTYLSNKNQTDFRNAGFGCCHSADKGKNPKQFVGAKVIFTSESIGKTLTGSSLRNASNCQCPQGILFKDSCSVKWFGLFCMQTFVSKWLRESHMSGDTVWILLQYYNIDRGKEGSEKEVGKCQAAMLAFCHQNAVLPVSSINVQTS